MQKPNCYIFDLDGTLANGNGRHFYNPTNAEVKADLPIVPVVIIADTLKFVGMKIIFLSGREDKYYEATKEWIKEHIGIEDPVLLMRKTKDSRPDSVIKKEIYERDIITNYSVVGVFDDRLQVCRMWYELGVFVFNVNQGLKEF